jgi:ribosome-binding factor A
MSERMRRVNESVRQVLAEAVPELKDPRIGLITVTGVDTAPDLRHATVYVSVLGSGRKQRAQTEADPAADLRVRSDGRARRAHDPPHRRAHAGRR